MTDAGGLSYVETGIAIRPDNVDEALSPLTDIDGSSGGAVLDGDTQGTSVGITARTIDPEGLSPVYSLVSDPTGWFAIDSATGVVTVKAGAIVDYESASVTNGLTSITVRAAAGGTPAVEETFAISIADVNEPPSTPTSNNPVTEYDENSTGATNVLFSSTDPDSDPITYLFATTGTDTYGNFKIVGNQLQVISALNYETQQSYSMGIIAQANGQTSETFMQTVNVGDVNEAPFGLADINGTAGSGSSGVVGQISDGAGAGTLPGITARATDPDSDSLTYNIVGGNIGNWFTINAATGVVSVASGKTVQYESTANGQVTLSIQASDGGLTTVNNSLTINIADVNETPTFTSVASASVSEAVSGPTFVATINTADPDKAGVAFGEAGHQISIVGGSSTFQILNGNELWTKTGVVLDYDAVANRTHNLTLQVRDNNGAAGYKYANQAFTVNVSPVDEAPSTPNHFGTSVNENNSGVLLTFGGSVDPEGETITYEFASGGNPGGLFSINGAGQLVLNNPLDFENKPGAFGSNNYVDVKVFATTPSGVNSAVRTSRITLLNVNEAPGTPSQPANGSINENATGFTGVTFIGATDPDGDSVSYVFANSSTISGNFEIKNGNKLHVRTAFDHETMPTAAVPTVYAFANGQRSANGRSLNVTVNNIDDNLPTASIARASGVLGAFAENVYNPQTSPNKLIGVVTASDADGDALTYSIVGGNPGNALYLNQNGELRLSSGFDYETLSGNTNLGEGPDFQYSVTVRTAQTNDSSRYVDRTLDLTIEDLDESITIYSGNGLPYTHVINDVGENTVDLGGGYIYKQVTTDIFEFPDIDQHDVYMSIFFDTNGNGQENPGEPILSQYYTSSSFGGILFANRPTTTTFLATGYQWQGTPWASNFVQQLPPIVFDLDGSGIRSTEITASFDIDGDGTKDQTGWISGGQGFLALDRDGDGLITHGAEISFIQDLPGARTDLEGLSAFDSNSDGIFDAQDERFGEFLVWQDANENGESEAGELLSLQEAGIASITLTGTPEQQSDEGNINIVATSTFTRTDGSTGAVGDVALRWDRGVNSVTDSGFAPGTVFAIDADGNGIVDPATETMTLAAALDSFDSDGDSQLTTSDDRYFDLRIWADSNGNGRTEVTELYGLDQDVPVDTTAPDTPVVNDIPAEAPEADTGGAGPDAAPADPPSVRPDIGQQMLERRMRDGLSESQLTMVRQALAEDADLMASPELGALRAGLNTGQPVQSVQNWSAEVPAGVDPFDYYEQGAAGMTVAPETTANSDAISPDIVSKELLPVDDLTGGTAVNDNGGPEMDSDALRIALMTQDMSVFGATASSESIKKRQNATTPVDYFAA